ncbi:MAG: PP2C family protein-serine/threonine phosphatase [Bacteriovoracia bacterium]
MIEQQQFKISMSVSTKLLLTISALLIIPIFFLNVSAISLFRKDKKAYVYDSQATLAALTGREFVSFLDNSLGTLRLVLGSIDSLKTLSTDAKNTIQFYLENQTVLMGIELQAVRPPLEGDNLWVARSAYRNFLPDPLKEIGLTEDKVDFDPKIYSSHSKEIEQSGFFFVNTTKNGLAPILSVFFVDPSSLEKEGYYKVAIGYVSLKHFLSGSSQSFNKFIITDTAGNPLFHSELKKMYAKESFAPDATFQEAKNTVAIAGAKEYFNPDGIHTLGSYYKPGFDLVVLSQVEYDAAMRATYTLNEKFIYLALAALGFMVILGLVFSKRLTAPLNQLFRATKQITQGVFDVNLKVMSRDEFGALTSAFVAMSKKISDLVQEMVDKVRVDQELSIAKTVQQSFFPPTWIENEHMHVASHYQSASECGGDWWGYFRVGNKHAVIIADATGHGLPSALMTASCRSCFSVIEKLAIDSRIQLTPADMLQLANRVVYDAAQGKIMMTCFIGIMDMDTHTVQYASAAHNPPWLFTQTETGFQMASLVASGQRLGEVQDVAEPYEVKEMSFGPNDTLVYYTDGLIEGKNKEGQQYGKKQSRQILEDSMSQDPKTIINNLMVDFLAFNSGKPLDDDVTLAVVRIQG